MEKKKIIRWAYNALVATFLLAGAGIVWAEFAHFGNIEFTDNARIRRHITPQNTRVQGFVREIRFQEYQQVKKGDTLVIIEDSEYRLRLAQARADLAHAEEAARATGSSIRTTGTTMHMTEAGMEEARVNLVNAQREDERFKKLLAADAVTQQQYERIHTDFLAAQARYEQVKRSRSVQGMVQSEQHHHLAAASAALEAARAAVEIAELNLSYCCITATGNGTLGAKQIQEGQLLQPGQHIADIVDSEQVWLEANYKESQLHHIAEGSHVTFTADAVPGITYTGIVERISRATGSALSLLPIDNATGNFVKVEQRVTVRIDISDNPSEELGKLQAGYNVECEVKY